MKAQPFSWVDWISEAAALAQTGLTYTTNEFDKERYQRLRTMVSELAAMQLDQSAAEIEAIFKLEQGYATPKLDVRSFVLQNNKVLLARERCDNLWTLPGGWVDVNQSPAEAALCEVKQETGFDVKVLKLLAVWDKNKHDHPRQWPHIHKYFFHCQILSGEPTPNLEISEIDFFSLDKLPPLSTPRVTETQLLRLYQLIPQDIPTAFD